MNQYDKLSLGWNKFRFYTLGYLTACYVLAGMTAEVHKHKMEILKIDPNFLVDNFSRFLPYKNQSDTDRILNALRKAGLK